jgi:hypothetical protein
MALGAAACFAGRPLNRGAAFRNGSTASELVARPHAGGTDEGPLGRPAAISHSALYEELAGQGLRPETLGPLNQIRDHEALIAVMRTFARSLGVRCTFCHVERDFAATTARKAVAAYMWSEFVAKLQFHDGHAVYCDSCHHETTVFLHRQPAPSERLALSRYMQTEYVNQLERRDHGAMGCATCHGNPINFRFLPRTGNPHGWQPPPPVEGAASLARE